MNFNIMNAAKLNRHFTIEVDAHGYAWIPSTPVFFDFGGDVGKSQIIHIHQSNNELALWVLTVDGDEFTVKNVEELSSKLRYTVLRHGVVA